ncbi:MAG: hypothetical protein QME83_07395 [Thermodesulfobacteriota bacterium]|nr:hypothetical protein [Thermodesulfobacteriota bacterium]
MAHVDVLKQVKTNHPEGEWNLCFQKCIYNYDGNGESEEGYRFIWRDQNGNLRPQRGQARIPDKNTLMSLIKLAEEDGWLE